MPPKRTDAKRDLQARHKAWITELTVLTKLKPSQLAQQAGVSDTTLTRLLNDGAYDGVLSPLTIEKLKVQYSVPGPDEFHSSRRLWGFSEAERLDYRAETELGLVIRTLVAERPHIDPWRLKTPALEDAGYLPGDLVLVDMNAKPEPQDAVCAQVYDWQRGAAETVWRVFDPPFLVAAARDRTAYKPLLVDGDRVVIKGVIVESFRPHRLSAAR